MGSLVCCQVSNTVRYKVIFFNSLSQFFLAKLCVSICEDTFIFPFVDRRRLNLDPSPLSDGSI